MIEGYEEERAILIANLKMAKRMLEKEFDDKTILELVEIDKEDLRILKKYIELNS